MQPDPSDPFNHFWHMLEGMLDNLSQPVAFATAPLMPPTPLPASAPVNGFTTSAGPSSDGSKVSNGLAATASRLLSNAWSSPTQAQAAPSKTLPPSSSDEDDLEFLDDGT